MFYTKQDKKDVNTAIIEAKRGAVDSAHEYTDAQIKELKTEVDKNISGLETRLGERLTANHQESQTAYERLTAQVTAATQRMDGIVAEATQKAIAAADARIESYWIDHGLMPIDNKAGVSAEKLAEQIRAGFKETLTRTLLQACYDGKSETYDGISVTVAKRPSRENTFSHQFMANKIDNPETILKAIIGSSAFNISPEWSECSTRRVLTNGTDVYLYFSGSSSDLVLKSLKLDDVSQSEQFYVAAFTQLFLGAADRYLQTSKQPDGTIYESAVKLVGEALDCLRKTGIWDNQTRKTLPTFQNIPALEDFALKLVQTYPTVARTCFAGPQEEQQK